MSILYHSSLGILKAMADLVLYSQTTVLLIVCGLQNSEYSLHSAFTLRPFWIEAEFNKCSEFPPSPMLCITEMKLGVTVRTWQGLKAWWQWLTTTIEIILGNKCKLLCARPCRGFWVYWFIQSSQTTLGGRGYCCFHFTHGESEAPWGSVTCLRLQNE